MPLAGMPALEKVQKQRKSGSGWYLHLLDFLAEEMQHRHAGKIKCDNLIIHPLTFLFLEVMWFSKQRS